MTLPDMIVAAARRFSGQPFTYDDMRRDFRRVVGKELETFFREEAIRAEDNNVWLVGDPVEWVNDLTAKLEKAVLGP